MRRIVGSVSFWLVLAVATVLALQVLPVTGIILMFAGAILWGGWLIQLTLVVIFIEALLRRIPRVLALLPLLFYGGYYAVYLSELVRFPAAVAEMELLPAEPALAFDPAVHKLAPRAANIHLLLASYEISTAYALLASSAVRHTISHDTHCEMISYRGNAPPPKTRGTGIYVEWLDAPFCFERDEVPKPDRGLITFESSSQERNAAGLPANVTTMTLVLDGTPLGSTSLGSIALLKIFPELWIGCGLIDMPSAWICGANLQRDQVVVHTEGHPLVDREIRLAKMLSLTPRSPEEIAALVRVRGPTASP
jgi:hypothetical protein